jgi:hypothetical protein
MLLTERIRCLRRDTPAITELVSVIRRLTSTEADALDDRKNQALNWTDTVAILDMQSAKKIDQKAPYWWGRLLSITDGSASASRVERVDSMGRTSGLLPQAKIPLYNGVALFPDEDQRKRLLKAVEVLLSVQRQRRIAESPLLSNLAGKHFNVVVQG